MSALAATPPDPPNLKAIDGGRKREAEVVPSRPVAPVRAWLRSLVAAEESVKGDKTPVQRVAKRVGVSSTRLEDILGNSLLRTISERDVDRMACAHGGVMLEEIFSSFGSADGETDESPERRCATPGCKASASGTRRIKIDGHWRNAPSLHCAEHRARLERIRASLDQDSKLMADNGGVPRKLAKSRHLKEPVCCAPGCYAPRELGERFCGGEACEKTGMTEEDYS